MEGDEVSGRESGVHAPMYGPQSTPITGMCVKSKLGLDRFTCVTLILYGLFIYCRLVYW